MGDALIANHHGMKWSTPDNDNDGMPSWNCADAVGTSFWYNNCFTANPLGFYSPPTPDQGIIWETQSQQITATTISFKIRERLCAEGSGLSCSACKQEAYLCTSDYGHLTCCKRKISTCEAARRTGIHDLVLGGEKAKVYCDMHTDGGGWTELLARRDGSVNDFYLYVFD